VGLWGDIQQTLESDTPLGGGEAEEVWGGEAGRTLRPWVKADGTLNTRFLRRLQGKVVALVMNMPGTTERVIAAHFAGLTPQTIKVICKQPSQC